jgi:hypothetical protein
MNADSSHSIHITSSSSHRQSPWAPQRISRNTRNELRGLVLAPSVQDDTASVNEEHEQVLTHEEAQAYLRYHQMSEHELAEPFDDRPQESQFDREEPLQHDRHRGHMALGGEPRQHVAPQLEPSPPVQLQYSICRKRPSIPRQRHQYRLLHSSLLRASDTHLPVIGVFQLSADMQCRLSSFLIIGIGVHDTVEIAMVTDPQVY